MERWWLSQPTMSVLTGEILMPNDERNQKLEFQNFGDLAKGAIIRF
jgi:hypothetical protein